ncbi:MAG: two pore domain potassium channel family protein [Methanobacteriaceae archaeon]|nr:two pore domain potassium channel family protein [Methanobacteriaceae archaeon]
MFNITVIGLVLLDIILLTALIFINNINPQLYQFILYFDLFVVIILIAQFIYKFKNSTSKTKYLKDNWFDLVGMVPEIVLPGFATFLRYFRLIRILSLFRRNLANFFNFLERTHLEYGITLIFILISAASIFYFFEHGINPNVNSIDDTIWYALITIRTVGFGDGTPQTIGGRVATVIIIVSGYWFRQLFGCNYYWMVF